VWGLIGRILAFSVAQRWLVVLLATAVSLIAVPDLDNVEHGQESACCAGAREPSIVANELTNQAHLAKVFSALLCSR
jgi:hypothetical protein